MEKYPYYWTSPNTFGLTNASRSARIEEPHCGPVAQLGARFHGMEEVVGSIPTRSTIFTRLESITSRAFARIVQKTYNRPDSGDRKCSLFTRVIYPPCKHTDIDHRRCRCPKWIHGTLDDGRVIRQCFRDDEKSRHLSKDSNRKSAFF